MSETLQIIVGMPTAALNAQPIVARQPHRLDSKRAGVFALYDPHRVELVVNGCAVAFCSGAPRAPTYVASGYYVHDSVEGQDRIRSVHFDIHAKPVSLMEAVELAEAACASMRRAALAPRGDRPPFGTISEALGSVSKFTIDSRGELLEAFTGPVRARSVVLCEFHDDEHSFSITITSIARAREQQMSVDLDLDDTYTVNVYLSQNLEDAIERAERSASALVEASRPTILIDLTPSSIW